MCVNEFKYIFIIKKLLFTMLFDSRVFKLVIRVYKIKTYDLSFTYFHDFHPLLIFIEKCDFQGLVKIY